MFKLNRILKYSKQIRFLNAGVFNTIFGYFLFLIALLVMKNFIENERYIYTFSVFISHLFSVILAFFVHKKYTFESNKIGVEACYEFFRFFNSYIFVFISNITLISIQIELLDIKAEIAGAIALPCSVLISYFFLSRYTFRA